MITTGLVLAGLTVSGFYMLYYKLPWRIKKFFIDRPLFTDATAALLTYILFGGTVTALMASAWACLITSIIIAIGKNPAAMTWVNRMKTKLREMITYLETFGANEDEHPIENPPTTIVELH